MSKLKDLVPPLELCKLIPAGAFEDSVFCWCEYNSQEEGYVRNGWRSTQDIDGDFIVAPRFSAEKNTFCHRENFKITRNGWHCPAPTLAEIMEELKTAMCVRWSSPVNGMHWLVKYDDLSDGGVLDINPATAALRLWLEVNGVEAKDE